MNNIIVDTGFWYAFYEERDDYHNKAAELFEYLSMGKIIIPFPSLYETINTRFAKRVDYMANFKRLIESDNVVLVDDSPYKDIALELTMDSSINKKKPYSLVDMIIRLMVSDVNMNIIAKYRRFNRPNYTAFLNNHYLCRIKH
jgi:Predicted nucleic acid-binding protein, contains PIN domain